MADDSVEWTSAQMIKNASNWSLCGDVALLNRLRQFSQTVISGAEALNTNVDKLLNNMEEVHLKLELTKNEFHGLRNTQFIENRVYEDDETLEIDEHQADLAQLTDEEKEVALKKSIAKGLEIMEKYYDKVELALSDSEGEGNDISYVMQPKDLYAARPLPYLVGSQEWHKKWHVGLLPSDSESESEPEEETYSNSNSDADLPKDRPLISETSSDLDFTNKEVDPDAHSTLNQSRGSKRLHSSSESSEKSSVQSKAPVSKQTFAEQLAEKLGNVVSSQGREPEVGAQPTKKFAPREKTANLFSDEPPPLDELDDGMLPKAARHALFTADLLSESTEANSSRQFQRENERNKEADHEKLPSVTSSGVSKSKGLFDSLGSSSEEDLLAITEKRKFVRPPVVNPYMQPFKTTVPFVDDEPPKLITGEVHVNEKKPADSKLIVENTADTKVAKKDLTEIFQAVNKSKVNEKKISLFDDSSDDEIFASKPKPGPSVYQPDLDKHLNKSEENRKPKEKVKPKKISLFDDDDLLDEEEEIFSGIYKKSTFPGDSKNTPRKPAKGLFDESDDIDIDVELGGKKASKDIAKSLAGDAPKSDNLKRVVPTKSVGLFDEPNISETKKTEVNHFGTGAVEVNKCKVVESDNVKEAPEIVDRSKIDHDSTTHEEEPAKLVTDMETNETADLCKSSSDWFGSTDEARKNVEDIEDVEERVLDETKSMQIEHNASLDKGDLTEVAMEDTEALKKSEVKFETPPHINLFDPTPPPVDWDASSDNSAESDTFSLSDGVLDRASYNQGQSASSVFDDAPPDLPIGEHTNSNYSSGIVRDMSASTSDPHGDSSFSPPATSSKRHFSDIFSEQQQQDSIFVTKNRISSLQVSSLNIAEQLDDSSKIDELTPSGTMGDLQNTDFEKVEVQPKPSPGKLKHNLNINVAALLPGAAPSKIRDNVQTSVTPPKEIPQPKTDVYLASPVSESLIKSESHVENYENLGGTEVLHSMTKDRARIPVKRRPSSRRARQEAARKSITDFNFYTENQHPSEEVEPSKQAGSNKESSKTPHSTENVIKGISLVFNQVDVSQFNANKELSETRAEGSEKLFGESAKLHKTKENNTPNKNKPLLERPQKPFEDTQRAEAAYIFNKPIVVNTSNERERIIGNSIKDELFKHTPKAEITLPDEELLKPTDLPAKASGSKYTDIFGDSSGSDEDLFGKSSKLPAVNPVEKRILSFVTESDSDGDLFAGKLPQTKNISQAKPTQKKEKSWIFDDSEGSSDDDLFGIKTKNTSIPSDTKGAGLKAKRSEIKTANIKKLEGTQVTDFDPLTGFQ